MHRRCPAWIRVLPAWTLALTVVATAAVAAPPRSLGTALIGSSQLSDDQIALIVAWADYYCEQMARPGADPLEIENARSQLVRPFQSPAPPSASFRFEYTRATIDRLRVIVQGENLHAAVNALRVIEMLGTTRALSVLLDHCNRLDEPRWQIRLRAAYGCRTVLSLGRDAVPPRQVTGIARRMLGAVREENRQIVLRRHLQAIAAAANADYPDDVRRQLRETWAQSFQLVVQSVVSQPPPSDLLGVLFAEGPAFREVYVGAEVSRSEQQQLARIVGPALGRALDVASKHSDAVRNDHQLKQLYGNVILFCQEFLTFIDLTERPDDDPPPTRFHRLWNGDWNNGDRKQFQDGVNLWQDILSGPPYK
ncbi:MAG: hypothetical protein ACYTGG_05370 [Planctomycetota bacterium]|jgi:hypothetical protein